MGSNARYKHTALCRLSVRHCGRQCAADGAPLMEHNTSQACASLWLVMRHEYTSSCIQWRQPLPSLPRC
jgi:hypothetical protein